MTAWMRQVLPPPSAQWVFWILFALLAGVECLLWWADIRLEFAGYGPRGALVMLASVVYGVFRAVAFHPACRPEYRLWLQATPWTNRLPLPLGPVHLVVQDCLVIAVLAALAYGVPGLTPMSIVVTCLCAYLVAVNALTAFTGVLVEPYVVAFGLAVLVRLAHHETTQLLMLACMYIVSVIGLRRSLSRFPWESTLVEHLRHMMAGRLVLT